MKIERERDGFREKEKQRQGLREKEREDRQREANRALKPSLCTF